VVVPVLVSWSQPYTGPAQYVVPTERLELQSTGDKEGLTAQNKCAGIAWPRQIPAQVSPSTTVYHLPQFLVVSAGTVEFTGGLIGVPVYPEPGDGPGARWVEYRRRM
jgi:hypothetical protein